MMTAKTQPQPAAETQRQEPAPAAEQPWPRSDFYATVMRLRSELESAIRAEKSKAQEISGLQDLSFARGIPASVLAGGQDKLEKLGNEQDAAQVAAHQARVALLKFIEDERARFFTLREEARNRLHDELTAHFERAKSAASEIIAQLQTQLGAKSETEREEQQIADWNRAARNLNRSVPAENVNNIPRVALIDAGESFRAIVARKLVSDHDLRELVRDFLAREDEKRARAEAHREFLEQQAKSGTIDDPSFDHRV